MPRMRAAARVVMPACVFALLGLVALGQSTVPVIEVASIKVNRTGQEWSTFGTSRGGRLTAVNSTVRELLQLVYQVQSYQLEGGPAWIGSDRYDILVKAEGELPPLAAPMPGREPSPVFLMIRSLLADRLKLAVHVETKTAPVYELIMARKDRRFGPRLTASDVDCGAYRAARRATAPLPAPGAPPPPPPGPGERVTCGMSGGQGRITGGAMPLVVFAVTLSRLVNRPVVDRTELSGNYDITLEFKPDQIPINAGAPGAAPNVDDRPSIFTALEEQLGLKLEPARGPVAFVVIDHIERPTED